MMMNFVETKDYTPSKIKADAKATLMEEIIAFLKERHGEDNVGMVRVGSGLSKKNTLAVRIGTVEFGEGSSDMCLKIDVSAADYCERVTTSKTFAAFDFNKATQAYTDYLAEKAEKSKSKTDDDESAAKKKEIVWEESNL